MMKSPSSLFFSLSLLASLALPARAGAPLTGLVQSFPSGTELRHPGLPLAREVWVDMIKGARERLDFGEFYIAQAPGRALEPVLQELEKAGARGVRIRFLLSAKGPENLPAALERLKRIPNLELRRLDLGRYSTGILHAKYFLVDGREMFVGSQNFDWRALEHIHEMGVRSADAALVRPLQSVFEQDWTCAGGGAPARPKAGMALVHGGGARLVAAPAFLNPADVPLSLDALVELMDGARKSLDIQLLVYSPLGHKGRYWSVLDQAIRRASVRGVQVRILLSDWMYGSKGLVHVQSLAVLPNIQARIISIPEAAEGHIPYARTAHSKYMVVDGATLWLGTSNWEEDYFEASRNVEVILPDPELARQGGEVFQRLWGSPLTSPLDPSRTYPARKVD